MEEKTYSYKPFERMVNYYETDRMGIVHHSNYIRYFEECRMDLFDQLGLDYVAMEEQGVMIPVLKVECEYRLPARFHDRIRIVPKIEKYSGIIFRISYEIIDVETGELHNTGWSEHCFINNHFKPVIIKREIPEIHKVLSDLEGVDLLSLDKMAE